MVPSDSVAIAKLEGGSINDVCAVCFQEVAEVLDSECEEGLQESTWYVCVGGVLSIGVELPQGFDDVWL